MPNAGTALGRCQLLPRLILDFRRADALTFSKTGVDADGLVLCISQNEEKKHDCSETEEYQLP